MAFLSDLTAAGIDWSILLQSAPTMQGDYQDGWQSTIVFKVPFGAQTLSFLKIAAGTVQTIGNVSRIIPLRHPDLPQMIARHFDVQGFGGQTQNGSVYGVSWSHNKIAVTFHSVPFGLDGSSPFMTIETTKSGEYITMPGNSFKFASDSTPIQQDSGIFVPTTVYAITLFQCPQLNDSTSDSLLGKVNSVPVFGKANGTVRYDGQQASLTMTSTMVPSYQKSMTFTYRAVPHNQILRPNGVWEAPVNQNDGSNIYGSGDLNALLI